MGIWRKSTYSSAQGGACIEVADSPRSVMIRDTKQAHMGDARTILSVSTDAWKSFTASLNQRK